VEIGIFDVRGYRVRTLRHEALAAGPQEVEWRGRDDDDRALASGVYLVRITSAAGELTGKMTLLK
jgi:flagellar hook assembly protein FlgD